MTNKNYALVIGAHGGIGNALCSQLATSHTLLSVSRSSHPTTHSDHHFVTTHEDDNIASICQQIKNTTNEGCLSHVIITLGKLHGDHYFPEKRIEDINRASLQTVFNTNTFLPILWLQQLLPVLRKQKQCTVAVLNARVGSLGDNQLGGWYSYRASKTALNMLLKNASIEFARRAKGIKLISFHPGTTDTALSQPFQHNIEEGKLFSPMFVATQLLDIMASSPHDGSLSYVDWQGNTIEW